MQLMVNVRVDSWQQQCCGKDLKVGSQVNWEVVHDTADLDDLGGWLTDVLGPTWTRTVALIQDNHDCTEGKTESLSGTVTSIEVMTHVFEPIAGEYRSYQAKSGTGLLRRIQVVDPWEREPKDTELAGWIVGIEPR